MSGCIERFQRQARVDVFEHERRFAFRALEGDHAVDKSHVVEAQIFQRGLIFGRLLRWEGPIVGAIVVGDHVDLRALEDEFLHLNRAAQQRHHFDSEHDAVGGDERRLGRVDAAPSRWSLEALGVGERSVVDRKAQSRPERDFDIVAKDEVAAGGLLDAAFGFARGQLLWKEGDE